MKIKDDEIDIKKAMEYSNYESLLLKHRKNGILLSNYQVNVLNNNGFNFDKYSNIHELLFDIEEYLNEEYNEELDLVSSQIAELLYYKDTKK